MSLDLTTNDLLLLEKYRLERLRSFFGNTLNLCFLHLDKNNTLAIHCSEPWVVDQVLNEINHLRWYAWIVVGARRLSIRLSIYFAEE
ncbi:hypothetical protein [Leptothermofonsia sp. ETS-13]|uniref:hypothetical protein n=1 Tax=Leptothermofonsia sp. ETS-13 TaxID=3035696 RepID=UPI003B9E4162